MGTSSRKRMPVADFLLEKLEVSKKSVGEVAAVCGWDNAKVVELLLSGKTKVPINRVQGLAQVLGVHPPYLLRLVLQEYMPEAWEAIVTIMEGGYIEDHERELLEAYRELSGGKPMAVLLAPASPVVSVYPSKGAEFR